MSRNAWVPNSKSHISASTQLIDYTYSVMVDGVIIYLLEITLSWAALENRLGFKLMQPRTNTYPPVLALFEPTRIIVSLIHIYYIIKRDPTNSVHVMNSEYLYSLALVKLAIVTFAHVGITKNWTRHFAAPVIFSSPLVYDNAYWGGPLKLILLSVLFKAQVPVWAGYVYYAFVLLGVNTSFTPSSARCSGHSSCDAF